MGKMAETMEKPGVRIRLRDGAKYCLVSYEFLRRKAVDEGEFTVIRAASGPKSDLFLRRDEVDAYDQGGIEGLRAFRAKQGRK